MKSIFVTKSFLPPQAEYDAYLKRIWSNYQLTNQGPLLKEFEDKIEKRLKIKNFHFVTNGTLALQLAIQAFGIDNGEIITTPFSYVATTSAILQEGCQPVFVDIEPDTFCIDPSKIEAAITKKTKAIMAVHVFGFPCKVDEIEAIAKRHKLTVIYDAAHAFGVEHRGKSLFNYGDASVSSFHATKLLHTIEGGGVNVKNKEVSDKIELKKRFGHHGDTHYMLGFNAKASEFQAAMGLCNLKYIDDLIKKRKMLTETYDRILETDFMIPKTGLDTKDNYIYYPLVFRSEQQLLKVITALETQKVFPRRYFYPSLSKLSYLKNARSCPISEDITRRILCLPLYPDLAKSDVERIANIVLGSK